MAPDAPPSHDDLLERFASLNQSGDHAAAAALAADHLGELMSADQNVMLAAVQTWDDSLLDQHPRLWLVRSERVGVLGVDPDIPPAAAGEWTGWCLERMMTARSSGDLTRAGALADMLEERHRLSATTRWPLKGASLLSLQVGLTRLLQGSKINALVHFSRAASQGSNEPESEQVRREALTMTALVHAYRGGRREALDALVRSRELGSPPSAFASSTRTAEDMVEALIALDDWNSHTKATAGRLDQVESSGELWPLVLHVRGRVALSAGDVAGVQELLSTALEVHGSNPSSLYEDISSALEAEAHLMAGDGVEMQLPGIGSIEGPLSLLVRARGHCLRRDAASAQVELKTLDERGSLASAARDEMELIRGWCGFIDDGSLTPQVARRMLRVVTLRRRLLTLLPESVRNAMLAVLDEAERDALGLLAVDMPGPAEGSAGAPGLSPGELRVLLALAEGKSLKAIAAELFVSVNTVKSQAASTYRKLGVGSRNDAVEVGRRWGLVEA